MHNNSHLPVRIRRLRDDIALPQYASDGAAGVDLRAALDEPVTIQPKQRYMVPTGLAIALPSRDWGAFLFPRSGLARSGLTLANSVGVIDADYRGEILCAMVNLGEERITVQPGDRIAQLVFLPVGVAQFIEVETLDETTRGSGGFGSTGVR